MSWDLGAGGKEETGFDIPWGSSVLDGSKLLLTAKLSTWHTHGLASGSLHPSEEKAGHFWRGRGQEKEKTIPSSPQVLKKSR